MAIPKPQLQIRAHGPAVVGSELAVVGVHGTVDLGDLASGFRVEAPDAHSVLTAEVTLIAERLDIAVEEWTLTPSDGRPFLAHVVERLGELKAMLPAGVEEAETLGRMIRAAAPAALLPRHGSMAEAAARREADR